MVLGCVAFVCSVGAHLLTDLDHLVDVGLHPHQLIADRIQPLNTQRQIGAAPRRNGERIFHVIEQVSDLVVLLNSHVILRHRGVRSVAHLVCVSLSSTLPQSGVGRRIRFGQVYHWQLRAWSILSNQNGSVSARTTLLSGCHAPKTKP